ncbi:DUF2345 domain-containing protein, partial [Stenotrophomonas maltophilia]|nr:DUF2345 domain-containing protein [Stenotrophomonas maltophilia]
GAYIRIEGDNIELGAPGKVEFKASQRDWVGPASVNAPLVLPNPADAYKLKYVLRDFAGQPMPNSPYVLVMPDGSTREGTTNAQGETEQVVTKGPQNIHLFVGDGETKHEGYYLNDEA